MGSINATGGASMPPQAPTGPSAQTFEYPYGGEREVVSDLGNRNRDRFEEDIPSRSGWRRFWTAGGIGAAIGGIGGGVAGAALMAGERGFGFGSGAVMGALGLGLLGGIGYAWLGRKDVPELAREDAAYSIDFDAVDRPRRPALESVPTVPANPQVGVVVPGITGTTAGLGVQLQQSWIERISGRTTSRENTNGEPVISIGDVSNVQTSWQDVVVRENVSVNALGLGRVMYDPAGYDSFDAAMDAYDGRHAVAVVHEGDRYYLADFDAQKYEGLGTGSNALMISDPRVNAILVSKGVYYPTDLQVGSPAPGGAAPQESSRLYLFGHDQDIDKTIPPALAGLDGRTIGWYDTNEPDRRDRTRLETDVRINGFHGGDEYSGPGFSTRDEALNYMLDASGHQGLVRSGDRYYVADLEAEASPDTIVHRSTRGAYIHGLRTTGEASRFELIEDQGGLYAPVGDWWVRMQQE